MCSWHVCACWVWRVWNARLKVVVRVSWLCTDRHPAHLRIRHGSLDGPGHSRDGNHQVLGLRRPDSQLLQVLCTRSQKWQWPFARTHERVPPMLWTPTWLRSRESIAGGQYSVALGITTSESATASRGVPNLHQQWGVGLICNSERQMSAPHIEFSGLALVSSVQRYSMTRLWRCAKNKIHAVS